MLSVQQKSPFGLFRNVMGGMGYEGEEEMTSHEVRKLSFMPICQR